jgi:cellulose synthase/poly-beta-1,6-N-acetylglucosamine synthase-like glycosyltransferase
MVYYTIVSATLATVLLGMHILLWVGIALEGARAKKRSAEAEKITPAQFPPVSIIIPARNEVRRIAPLLASLEKQTYNNQATGGFEIIFIDDCSDDGTAELLSEFCSRVACAKLFTLTKNDGNNRKQFAISEALKIARGEILLFTDADCEVPPTWAMAMTSYLLSDTACAAVLGPVLKKWSSDSYFSRFQSYDHAVRFIYLVGTCGFGGAGGSFGNNLALRRSALDEAGGYEAVPASPTEDAALITMLRKKTSLTIRAALAKETQVLTESEANFGAFINQTLRWQVGALNSPDKKTAASSRALMYLLTLGVLALPFIPFFPQLWFLSAAVFFTMLPTSIFVLHLLQANKPPKNLRTANLPPFRADYILSAFLTPVNYALLTLLASARKKFTWK